MGLQEAEDNKELLGFAITLAGFCIIALKEIVAIFREEYLAYNYFIVLTFVESILVAILLLLILSILFRGYSLVAKNKTNLVNYSSIFYSSSFLLFFYAFGISIYIYLSFFTFNFYQNALLISVGYLILAVVLIGITLYVTNKSENGAYIFLLTLLFAFIFASLFGAFIDYKSPTVEVEMQDLYEFDNQIIPISIKVNGYNNALSVEMYQENNSNKLNLIDENMIWINPVDKTVEHGTYVFGNYLDNGNYILFMNTSGLDSGYYELHVNVNKTRKTVSGGFYLTGESSNLGGTVLTHE